jgi:hypothetical protein
MRGRLINPFLAELARLDTAATAADPDGAGPLTSGYDPDFKETVVLPAAGSARREQPPIRLQCQVEIGTFEALQQLASGASPNSRWSWCSTSEILSARASWTRRPGTRS